MHAILTTAIDEAIAIIDRFIAADSSAPAFAAVIKMLLGKIRAAADALAPDMQELEDFRAKVEADRKKAKSRMQVLRVKQNRSRTFANVRELANDDPSRARSSSTLEEEKIDDDDDPRARNENKISADELAATVEKITRVNGHLPIGGWNRAALVAHLQKHVTAGRSAQLIIGAFRSVSARAPAGVISSFTYFDKAIIEDHRIAMSQLELRIPVSVSKRQAHGKRSPTDLDARIAAADARELEGDIGDTADAGVGGTSRDQGSSVSLVPHKGA